MGNNTDLTRHEQLMAVLKDPHSILLVPTDDPIRPKCDQGWYVCYEFALGVTALPSYVRMREFCKDESSVDQRFVGWLMKKNVLVEVEHQHARDGDVVIYFGPRVSEGVCVGPTLPKHAGRIRLARIVSKWGRHYPLYDHAVEEVPELYGDECRFFKGVSPELVYCKFLELYKPDPSKIPESFQ